jgi:hypothetical protein
MGFFSLSLRDFYLFFFFILLPVVYYLGQFLLIDEEQLISLSLIVLFINILFFSSISNIVIFNLNSRIFLFAESLRRLEFLNFLILNTYFISLKTIIFSYILPQLLNFFLIRYKFFRTMSIKALRNFFLICNFHEFLYITLIFQWCSFIFFQKLFELSILSLNLISEFLGIKGFLLPILSCFPINSLFSIFHCLAINPSEHYGLDNNLQLFSNFINFLFFTNSFFNAKFNIEFNFDDFEELFFFYCPKPIFHLISQHCWDFSFWTKKTQYFFLSFLGDFFDFSDFDPIIFLQHQNFLGFQISYFTNSMNDICDFPSTLDNFNIDLLLFREWICSFLDLRDELFFFFLPLLQYTEIYFLLTFLFSFSFNFAHFPAFFSISESCLYFLDHISRRNYIQLLFLNCSTDDLWENFVIEYEYTCLNNSLNLANTFFIYDFWRVSSWPISFRFLLSSNDLL